MEYDTASTESIDSVVPEAFGGELTVRVGGTGDDPAAELVRSTGEAIRVGAGTRRELENGGDERVRVVIAGTP